MRFFTSQVRVAVLVYKFAREYFVIVCRGYFQSGDFNFCFNVQMGSLFLKVGVIRIHVIDSNGYMSYIHFGQFSQSCWEIVRFEARSSQSNTVYLLMKTLFSSPNDVNVIPEILPLFRRHLTEYVHVTYNIKCNNGW